MTNEKILKRRASQKRWRERNPDAQKIKCKKWREANKNKTAEYRRNYRLKNALLDKQITKNWRASNMPRVLLTNAKRRALLRSVTYEKVAPSDISNWETRLCGICNKLIEDKFHIDHIIPLIRGGTHTASNLQLTHPICNLRKNSKLTEEMSVLLLD